MLFVSGNSPGHKWDEATFHTKCWHLTLYCHHLALVPACNKYHRRVRASRDLQKLLDETTASQPQWRDTPFASRYKNSIKRWKQQIKKLNRSKACADAGLLDRNLMRRTMTFYNTVAEAMLALLTNRQPGTGFTVPTLPLPSTAPILFSALPEWYIEDIVEVLLFALQYCPIIISEYVDDPLVSWLLVIICSAHYIKNPYLVARLIEVLFAIHPAINIKTERLHERILSHPISETHLASSLMKFYTDVETTGSSSEFYDKFSIRYHISLILQVSHKIYQHYQIVII